MYSTTEIYTKDIVPIQPIALYGSILIIKGRAMKKIISIIFLFIFVASCDKKQSPLKDFVTNNDPSFTYEIVNTIKGEKWTTKVVKMVSQNWLTQDEVNLPEWWHWLTIVIPDNREETEALMVVSGGSHKNEVPNEANKALIGAAIGTNSVVASISNIPFQPLSYKNDHQDDRYEDDIIAYGWRNFLEGGAKSEDAYWLAHLPMTKAVMRGMDVVQEIAAVDSFVVTGGSKRGWTTWTTGISDSRVKAIIPIVIDVLNVVPSFNHHWKCYGDWSPAIDSYKNEGIMDWMGSKEFDQMLDIMEPYSFVKELTLPKFLINATGDEFFVTDSWQFYWNDLVGPKYLQYIPNTNHGLNGSYNLGSLIAFYDSIIKDKSIPQFDWKITDNTILIDIPNQGIEYEIRKWTAMNKETRDFRVAIIGRSWESESISISNNGHYSIKIDSPETGYKAGLVEIIFKTDPNYPMTFTSGTVVTPNTFPFGDFKSKQPKGTYE